MDRLKVHQLPLLIRDRRRQHWHWVSNSVIDLYGQFIGPVALAVYSCLCRFAHYDDQVAGPSIKAIAGLIGTGHNQVRRGLKKLEAMGLITIQVRDGRPKAYFLLEPASDLAEITKRYDILKSGEARFLLTPTRSDTPLSLGRGPLPTRMPRIHALDNDAVVDLSITIQQHTSKKAEMDLIYQALTDFGIAPDMALKLLRNEPPAPVVTLVAAQHWIEHASDTSKGIRNPQGFVVDRLRKGIAPPPPRIRRGSKEDRYRYFQGECAEMVE